MRALIVLLFALLPTAAEAGLRATYARDRSPPLLVEIADNGDFAADLWDGRRLVVRGGEAFVVEERLTGPIVTRLADLAAVPLPEALVTTGIIAPGTDYTVVERGTVEVNGRTGRAFFSGRDERAPPEPILVISDDPALAALIPAMRQLFEASDVLERIEFGPAGAPPILDGDRRVSALLSAGALLSYGNLTLREVEQVAIPAEALAVPAEAEGRVALAEQLAREAAEEEHPRSPIAEAAFGAGRLWLLDDDGGLASLAEGETVRRRHDPGGRVVAICAAGDRVLAITGRSDGGPWTVRALDGERWTVLRTIARARGDALLALSCEGAGGMVLTSRHLEDLGQAQGAPRRLSQPVAGGYVDTTMHVTESHVFVGLNAGEWGGGMKRINRRSGEVVTLERNATGELCDGPLNTQCDPVHAIVTIPWRPECVAAAVGLIHMMPRGRIVELCDGRIEQMLAANASADPADPRQAAEVAAGGYGSAPFFGLVARGERLIAAAHNGLHRISADGSASHSRWPRFTEVDGVLVSFAEPEVVLVITRINRRASVSGATPLLVPR